MGGGQRGPGVSHRRFLLAAALLTSSLLFALTSLAGSGAGAATGTAAGASNRYVALGDSVPYGHGLANPYTTPQIGLPAAAVSQGPSPDAYPSLVAQALGLSLALRPTNCGLTGDQLAISGAMAATANVVTGDGQCALPKGRNVQADEVAATRLTTDPAKLVTIQAGADDIDFGGCLEYALTQPVAAGLGLGVSCVQNGAVTSAVAAELVQVRSALTSIIEQVAPHAANVAVLNYYQPIPSPAQMSTLSLFSGGNLDLVCLGLTVNDSSAYAAAQVVDGALNQTIAAAVQDARTRGVPNVSLVDLSTVAAGQGMCTADPAFFSGEPMSAVQLAIDAAEILAARPCDTIGPLLGAATCASLGAQASVATRDITSYVWRAAHPTPLGQQEIAAAVDSQLAAVHP
jgi:hypothetical protein